MNMKRDKILIKFRLNMIVLTLQYILLLCRTVGLCMKELCQEHICDVCLASQPRDMDLKKIGNESGKERFGRDTRGRQGDRGDGVSEIRSTRLNSECSILFTQKVARIYITLQMLTDKLLINYYFHMLLLQVKMCKLFKSS